MNYKSMTIIIITLFSLLVVQSAVYAFTWNNDGGYHWECMHDGDKLVIKKCTHTLCIVCQKLGYTTLPLYCSDQVQSCSHTTDNGSIDPTPPTITLNSPANGAVFNTKSVPFDIQTNKSADYYYINNADEGRGYTRICTKCTRFQRTISLNDGMNNITLKAEDSNANEAYKGVIFYVDSKKPVIKSVSPKSGSFANGRFSVEYDEENLKKATLYWKPDSSSSYNGIQRNDCPKGLKQRCNITVSSLPQGTINYYFRIEDLATFVDSAVQTVYVDTIAPVITRNDPQNMAAYAEKLVPFNLYISEFVNLEYIDYKDKRPTYKILCKNCQTYSKGVNFNDGNHSVQIRATDKAGNFGTNLVSFFVDSVEPKIKEMLPKDKTYCSGLFQVTVEEQNLQAVILHYQENGKQFVAVQKKPGDCTNLGKNVYKCLFNIQLTAQGPLGYYFEVQDIATSVESKTFGVTADTIQPAITVYSPTSQTNKRSVKFNITTSEPVTLEYTDNAVPIPRPTKLCEKCTKYVGTKTMGLGPHDIFIKATDYAGNTNQVERQFTVII